jgi:S1-C subfamily serine protease
MNDLSHVSNSIADIVEAASTSVVQVHGRRRPASGIVFRDRLVLTTTAALGRDDGLRVRAADGVEHPAELAGWDAATSLVLLNTAGLDAPAFTPSTTPPRVGHLTIAIARSWTNAVTATTGNVAVMGGPLRTGRGVRIDRVIRTSAPMHSGFAGGAVLDAAGGLLGVATAAEIRGLAVVIPADIAWSVAAELADKGTVGRGYIGIAGQAVKLPERQRAAETGAATGMVVLGVSEGSPADAGGILVGDIVVAFDGHAVGSPMELLDLLTGDRIGRGAVLSVLRGGTTIDLTVTVGRRPAR